MAASVWSLDPAEPLCYSRSMNRPTPGTVNVPPRPTLIIMQGVPGSGKSTWALDYQLARQDAVDYALLNAGAVYVPKDLIIVSRDDLRKAFYNTHFGGPVDENFIRETQQVIVLRALADNKDVIVDDTNLSARGVMRWRDQALVSRAIFRIHRMPMHNEQHLELAIDQNNARTTKKVPTPEILRMWDDFHNPENLALLQNLDPGTYIE